MSASASGKTPDTPALDDIRSAVKGLDPRPVGHYSYFSVLIPLVEKDGELHILYEVRSDELRRQPGEISFPGVRMEDGESAADCAVRETCEELCIPECAVSLIGELNYIITYSNFTMYCFLGIIDADALSGNLPNSAEVKETFTVPLSFLLENEPEIYINRVAPIVSDDFPLDKIHPGEGYAWREGRNEVLIYTYRDEDTGREYVIWGLTARLTNDFIGIINR
ncbi:MAG: CoA pyrophosphatase [Clostridiales Family XIII bacterium]|jgi:8-oxo-dGTP pyrophosphatase MutT (NUDIX family)|nr:CoA pyrophosphatase [Clostridiales Family XIII bacterium]